MRLMSGGRSLRSPKTFCWLAGIPVGHLAIQDRFAEEIAISASDHITKKGPGMPIEDGANRTTLYVGGEFPGAISVELEPSRHYCWLMDQTISDTSPLPRVQVLTVGVVRGHISIFPVYTFPQAGRFLQPRYQPLTEICLEVDRSAQKV